jgi:hypothetical protein
VCFSVVHRKKPAEDSPEFKKARSYCFGNSKYDPKLQARIFVKTFEDLVANVNISLGVCTDPELIPEVPQGLVLADNRCTGAFQ